MCIYSWCSSVTSKAIFIFYIVLFVAKCPIGLLILSNKFLAVKWWGCKFDFPGRCVKIIDILVNINSILQLICYVALLNSGNGSLIYRCSPLLCSSIRCECDLCTYEHFPLNSVFMLFKHMPNKYNAWDEFGQIDS